MYIRLATAFLLILCLSYCSTEPDQPPRPSEWIVIGNDLGFRNEFVDMANIVRLRDSSLTVYSVAYPDVELQFPIVNNKVIGSKDKHWRLEKVGTDTLLLIDTVQENRYHLLRLQEFVTSTDLESYFTGQRFRQSQYGGETIISFQGTDASEPNCYVSHGYSLRDSIRRPHRLKDGFWRLDERFAQPMLLYTRGQGEHFVNVIDTITTDGDISGRLVINSQPNLKEIRLELKRMEESMSHAAILASLDSLRLEDQQVVPFIDPEVDPYWRVAWSGKELQKKLNVADFELEDLRLNLAAQRFEISTSNQVLFEGEWAVHPELPYLVLDGSCGNEAYLPVELAEDEWLNITFPMRIQLTEIEIPASPFGEDTEDRIAYSENALVFKIPYGKASK